MLAILFAVIIANAFILLQFSPLNYYKLHRYDGQLLYIKATFLGIVVTAIAFLLNSYLSITDRLSSLILFQKSNPFGETEHLDVLFILFLFTLLLSFIYCLLEKLVLWLWTFYKFRGTEKISYSAMSKILLMYRLLKDSPLDKLLYLSYVQNKFLLITLSDRKVYVGRVVSMGEPNEHEGPDQEIAIVPVFSGYRDKDSLEVSLTRTYKDIAEVGDVYLVLKQSNIVSACEFVESLYEKFTTQTDAKAK